MEGGGSFGIFTKEFLMHGSDGVEISTFGWRWDGCRFGGFFSSCFFGSGGFCSSFFSGGFSGGFLAVCVFLVSRRRSWSGGFSHNRGCLGAVVSFE